LEDANASFPQLLADIDGATRSVDLELYIWSPGGMADEAAECLMRESPATTDLRFLPLLLTVESVPHGRIRR
jgi:hypothetical protein